MGGFIWLTTHNSLNFCFYFSLDSILFFFQIFLFAQLFFIPFFASQILSKPRIPVFSNYLVYYLCMLPFSTQVICIDIDKSPSFLYLNTKFLKSLKPLFEPHNGIGDSDG